MSADCRARHGEVLMSLAIACSASSGSIGAGACCAAWISMATASVGETDQVRRSCARSLSFKRLNLPISARYAFEIRSYCSKNEARACSHD
jgi:hypothetical protein